MEIDFSVLCGHVVLDLFQDLIQCGHSLNTNSGPSNQHLSSELLCNGILLQGVRLPPDPPPYLSLLELAVAPQQRTAQEGTLSQMAPFSALCLPIP